MSNKFALLIFVLSSALVNAHAAPATTGSNASTANAALHIRVFVVPMVLPPHRQQKVISGPVNYDFNVRSSHVEVTEQARPFAGQRKSEAAILRTTTITAK